MSKAEDLLNTLTNPGIVVHLADMSTEPHIVIGDDRFITVPDELKRIAVQRDHNVETVTFDCPRYWDEHDMSKMTIYINYLRSDEETGLFRGENVTVDPDDPSIMHFDWTITRNVTEVFGPIVFLVCIKIADAEGNEKIHWNSELCKSCTVSEGLEIDGEELKEIYPDIIEQWYQEVVGVINDFNSTRDEMFNDFNNTRDEMFNDFNSTRDEKFNELDNVKNNLITMRDSGEFDGATFIPSVSDDCDLSWTNNKGRDNPPTVNIRGKQGVSPVVQVKDIHGGHRITITDVNGTKSIDVMDTIVDSTEAVAKMLKDFVYIGEDEPTSGPVLWFDTNYNSASDLSAIVEDLVRSELEAIENGSY